MSPAQRAHFGAAGNAQLHDRVKDGHHRFVRLVALVDDHVAGQQQADVPLRRQGLVGQGRRTGAQDAVSGHVDIEFFLEGLLDVDFSQNAEPLIGQGFPELRFSLVRPHGHRLLESVAELLCSHRISSLRQISTRRLTIRRA